MNDVRRSPAAGTTKAPKKTESPVRYSHMYFTTGLLAISTVISGWNIEGVWDGIATMVIGIITVLMVNELIGGYVE